VAVIVDPVLGFSPRLTQNSGPSSLLLQGRTDCGGAAVCDKLGDLSEVLPTAGRGAMPTYVVGDIHVTDLAAYEAHVPRALATIARFAGRVIAGGGKIDLLEGDPIPERIFIIEFPNADAARRWYQSDDYKEALKVRLSASNGRVFLIEGNEISTAVPVPGSIPGKD
jgi:uncharacterized protein (DUF1330 family)